MCGHTFLPSEVGTKVHHVDLYRKTRPGGSAFLRSLEELFLCLLVHGVFLTPTAILLELNLARDKLLILA